MAELDNPILAKGIELYRGDGNSPEDFDKIPRLISISPVPNTIRDLKEVTDHDSPGTDKEYILGLGEGSEPTFQFNYIHNEFQDALLDDKEGSAVVNFQLRFPYLSPEIVIPFSALVRSWELSTAAGEPLVLSVQTKVSGSAIPSGVA